MVSKVSPCSPRLGTLLPKDASHPSSCPSARPPCRARHRLPSLPAIRDGSDDRLPATAEINPRTMAHVLSFLKETWTAALSQAVSTASCASHAASSEVPAVLRARQRLHAAGPGLLSGGQSCAFPIPKSSSLDKYPAGSHACKGTSFLLNQGIAKEEPRLLPGACKQPKVLMLPRAASGHSNSAHP